MNSRLESNKKKLRLWRVPREDEEREEVRGEARSEAGDQSDPPPTNSRDGEYCIEFRVQGLECRVESASLSFTGVPRS